MTTNQILRVALYIRVSTEEQAMHGISLIAQEDSLVRYAQDRGYKIVGIYRDEGNSARKPVSKRPVMLQLLEDVKSGKIDRILFTKFDRWSRNVREYHNVQEILEAHNGSTIYRYPWGGADYTGRLCVIGSKLDESALKALFEV